MIRAVFLARDGVINELVDDPEAERPDGPLHPDGVRLVPGAGRALKQLHEAGLLLVAASNQPGAAEGRTTEDELRAVHARVVELLAEKGAFLDDWRYCLHGAEDGCACRKPNPGLLLDAAQAHGIDLAASWMVGHADTDVEAGRRAGVRTVLVEHPRSADRRSGTAAPELTAPDLERAAEAMLSRL